MIEGVKITKLRKLIDERGFLMEIMRDDSPQFRRFGQVYLTGCNPGYVKGWHVHKKQTDNFAVVSGSARILLYDTRDDSKTKGETMEIFSSEEENQSIITIPPGVAHGWECVGDKILLVVNCPDLHYEYDKPDEFRIDPFDNDIPIKWNSKKGG